MTIQDKGGSDFDFERIANSMPLVTVIPVEKFDGPLPSDPPELGVAWLGKSDATKDFEELCKLDDPEPHGPQRYFYAGRAGSGFGGIAFAYDASIDRREGDATPFDSGELCRGAIKPANLSDSENKKLIENTKKDLAQWRASFREFLAAFFPDPRNYFHGRPCTDANLGPPELPARHKNTHFIAWTWEARIHEPHPLLDGLLLWAAPRETFRKLTGHGSEWDAPSWVKRLLEIEHIDLGSIKKNLGSEKLSHDAFQVVEDRIQQWLFEEKR